MYFVHRIPVKGTRVEDGYISFLKLITEDSSFKSSYKGSLYITSLNWRCWGIALRNGGLLVGCRQNTITTRTLSDHCWGTLGQGNDSKNAHMCNIPYLHHPCDPKKGKICSEYENSPFQSYHRMGHFECLFKNIKHIFTIQKRTCQLKCNITDWRIFTCTMGADPPALFQHWYCQ